MKIQKPDQLKPAKSFPYILFLLFVIFEICIYLLNKFTSIEATGNGYRYYLNIIMAPWLWITLALATIQLFLWIKLLSESELSFVYSISSLSYPLTMLIATFLFKESLPILVWIGGGLITLGVLLIGINPQYSCNVSENPEIIQ